MYVYVISSKLSGPSKIGRAVDPVRRIRGLKSGSPAELIIHLSQPTGLVTEFVEREAHRVLAGRRTIGGGTEWFDVDPLEACVVVRVVTECSSVLTESEKSLMDIQTVALLLWLRECEELKSDEDEEGGGEILDILGDVLAPSPLRLFAQTCRPPLHTRANFDDYLRSFEEGMWLRWAFERLDRRLPSGKSLLPYLDADDFLETQNGKIGRDICWRWIEWSNSRDLTSSELHSLSQLWDRFAALHNDIEKNGPQWATAGVDDQIDDVHLFAVEGDKSRGDQARIVFAHRDFRAILLLDRTFSPYSGEKLFPVATRVSSGFIVPPRPLDIWERPLLPWVRTASRARDTAFMAFLQNSNKKFPSPRPYDGPQPATEIHVQLSCIDESGFF